MKNETLSKGKLGAVASVFPPEGWTAHPSAPGYFYKGQEVLSEDELRAGIRKQI